MKVETEGLVVIEIVNGSKGMWYEGLEGKQFFAFGWDDDDSNILILHKDNTNSVTHYVQFTDCKINNGDFYTLIEN